MDQYLGESFLACFADSDHPNGYFRTLPQSTQRTVLQLAELLLVSPPEQARAEALRLIQILLRKVEESDEVPEQFAVSLYELLQVLGWEHEEVDAEGNRPLYSIIQTAREFLRPHVPGSEVDVETYAENEALCRALVDKFVIFFQISNDKTRPLIEQIAAYFIEAFMDMPEESLYLQFGIEDRETYLASEDFMRLYVSVAITSLRAFGILSTEEAAALQEQWREQNQ